MLHLCSNHHGKKRHCRFHTSHHYNSLPKPKIFTILFDRYSEIAITAHQNVENEHHKTLNKDAQNGRFL